MTQHKPNGATKEISRYWSTINTPKRPRDIVYSLHGPHTATLSTKSSEMAEIARRYHDELQQSDRPEYNDPECQTARLSVLHEIPEDQTLNDPHSPLNFLITDEQVSRALLQSKNGTLTGLDGIPYEVWKTLSSLHISNATLRKPSFDVIKCLRIVYNEIQTKGADPTTDFSAGWMCPVYKTKDKTRIENYRPITLPNTDYKLKTKVLETQLQVASHACNLLHPDQTGFVPTCHIFNPIRLAETMCAYADYMEEAGAIITLDQERHFIKLGW